MATRVPAAFRAAYGRPSPDGASHGVAHVEKSRLLRMTEVVITPEELVRIPVPVLAVAGDQDFAPLEHTIALLRGLRQGELYIVPATGHDGLTSRSAEVDAVMRRFLAALR